MPTVEPVIAARQIWHAPQPTLFTTTHPAVTVVGADVAAVVTAGVGAGVAADVIVVVLVVKQSCGVVAHKQSKSTCQCCYYKHN